MHDADVSRQAPGNADDRQVERFATLATPTGTLP